MNDKKRLDIKKDIINKKKLSDRKLEIKIDDELDSKQTVIKNPISVKKFESPTFNKTKPLKSNFSNCKSSAKKNDKQEKPKKNISEGDLLTLGKLEQKISYSLTNSFNDFKAILNNQFYSDYGKLKGNIKSFILQYPDAIDSVVDFLNNIIDDQISNQRKTTYPQSSTIKSTNDYISDIENYKLDNTTMSDDSYMIDYITQKKNNSVFFEISFKERAMSESKMLRKRLTNNKETSKEELETRLQQKYKNIEGNKNQLIKNSNQQMEKLRKKIKEIKMKKRETQQEQRIKI